MIPCAIPVEVVATLSTHLGLMDFQSMRVTWEVLQIFIPSVLRDLYGTKALCAEYKPPTMNEILSCDDLRYVQVALDSGLELNQQQLLSLLSPFRGETLRLVYHKSGSRSKAYIGWREVLASVNDESDLLVLLSFWKSKGPISEQEARKLVSLKFTQVLEYVRERRHNAPWLHYLSITDPEVFQNAEDPWLVFEKLYLRKDTQRKPPKGYRLENATVGNFTRALSCILSRVRDVEHLTMYEKEVRSRSFVDFAHSEKLFLQTKLRLNWSIKDIGLPTCLTDDLVCALTETQLTEAIRAGIFTQLRRSAVCTLVSKQYYAVIVALVVRDVGDIWDHLLQTNALLQPAVADKVTELSGAGPKRPLSPHQATMLMRSGQWVYLAAHSEWGRSMSLTYIAVGLGHVDFVSLMLKRMGPAGTFPGGSDPPFNLSGALSLAKERNQGLMVRYLNNLSLRQSVSKA